MSVYCAVRRYSLSPKGKSDKTLLFTAFGGSSAEGFSTSLKKGGLVYIIIETDGDAHDGSLSAVLVEAPTY